MEKLSLIERLGDHRVAPIPPAHLGLSYRAYTDADMAAFEQLVLAAEQYVSPQRSTTYSELSGVLDLLNNSPYADCLCGFDKHGTVQAFAAVFIHPGDEEQARADLFAITAPQWRGKGLGRCLLKWQDIRARQLLIKKFGPDSKLPALIRNSVEGAAMDRRRLYTAAGFSSISEIDHFRLDINDATMEQVQQITANPAHATAAGLKIVRGIYYSHENAGEIEDSHYALSRKAGATSAEAKRWWRRIWERHQCYLSAFAVDHDGSIKAYCLGQIWDQLLPSQNPSKQIVALEGLGSSVGSEILAEVVAAAISDCEQHGVEQIRAEDNHSYQSQISEALGAVGFTASGIRKIYAVEC